jgi:lysophospholipase L1-like esterase
MLIRGPRPATAVILLAVSLCNSAHADDFALHDGDTVVFLGDSITAARTYGKIIENYTLLRFPDRKVRFFNAGEGGDTAAGGLARFDRDVLSLNPTVVTVAYGINDIGWGTRADAAHKQAYLDGIRGIIDRCRERKIRVFIGSAAVPREEDPDKAETEFLQTMCDEGLALARTQGAGAIDIQRFMREVLRRVRKAGEGKPEKDRPTMHAPDGIHLNDLGQLAMAVAILKGLGAPSEVSSVAVDAASLSVIDTTGCAVTDLKRNGPAIEFDRLDNGLPINFGVLGGLQFAFVPVPELLNRYMLTVKGLPPGRYEILADNRPLGTWDADLLARGLDIASATADGWQPGGPWDAQAYLLIRATEARRQIAETRRDLDRYLPAHPKLDSIHAQTDSIDSQITDLQRSLTRPRPFHFVVRPATPKPGPTEAK